MEQFEALQTQAAAAVQSSKKESVHKSAEEIEEESKCLLERLEEVKGVKEDVLRWDSAIEEERRQVLYSPPFRWTVSMDTLLSRSNYKTQCVYSAHSLYLTRYIYQKVRHEMFNRI